MATSVAEKHVPALDIESGPCNAAANHGITLGQDRLTRLSALARFKLRQDQSPNPLTRAFDDLENGVAVERKTYLDHFGGTAAKVDFAPIANPKDGDMISGSASAEPEHSTQFTLMGIRGLQNYVLLVEAGIIEKPDVLYGITNPTMAIIAERVGMLTDIARLNKDDPAQAHKDMRKQAHLEVYGSFDEVSERVFSTEVKEMERKFALRLAAQKPVGALVLAAK